MSTFSTHVDNVSRHPSSVYDLEMTLQLSKNLFNSRFMAKSFVFINNN